MPHEVTGPSRTKLFEVENCFGGVDVVGTGAYVVFLQCTPLRHQYLTVCSVMRMDTWKGAIRLSFFFNDGHFSYKQAQSFTADIARYMVDFIK